MEITLLIKPASYRCNLECAYCFYKRVGLVYPGARPEMSLETARIIIRNTLSLGCERNNFCWQGGEPTLMGIEFFREVVGFQKRYAAPGQVIGNSFQTNGVLINEKWADFFAENCFFIGLSLDGPEEIHNRYRRFPSGKGTFQEVMNAARLLRERQVEFNILTLLTDSNVNQPAVLYRFFRKNDFRHLQFIPCFEIDPVTGAPYPFSISGMQLGRFNRELFDLWLKEGFLDVSIRAFEDFLIFLIDGAHVSCPWMEKCGSYLVVEHNGDVYPCDFYVYPEWKIGNIAEEPLAKITRNPILHRFSEMKADLPAACRDCGWLPFCHGGCTRLRTREGEAGAFCQADKMLLEHMEPHLERIKKRTLRLRQQAQSHSWFRDTGRNAPCPCGSGAKFKKCCGKM